MKGLKGLLAAGALVACTAAPAGALADSGHNAKADISHGTYFGECSDKYAGNAPVVGSAHFHRKGNAVSIDYRLNDPLDANTTVRIGLRSPDNNCLYEYIGYPDSFVIDGTGAAIWRGTATVPSNVTHLFIDLHLDKPGRRYGLVGFDPTSTVTLTP